MKPYNYETVKNIETIIRNMPDLILDHIEHCCSEYDPHPPHRGEPCYRVWAHIKKDGIIIKSEQYGAHFPEAIEDKQIRWLMMNHRISWQNMAKFSRVELEELMGVAQNNPLVKKQIEIALSQPWVK